MTQAYGPDWPRHRLPNGIYEKWAEKKNGLRTQAGGHGRSSHTPISQTTRQFSAAATISGRYSRGTSAAQGASKRPSSGFIRSVDTMHARPITQDDELLLYVERRRLVKMIAIAIVGRPDDE
jgi:hypothetical protein